MNQDKKKCKECGIPKPATHEYFYLLSKIGNRLKTRCKECEKKYSIKHYDKTRKRPRKIKEFFKVKLSKEQRAKAAEYMRMLSQKDMALEMIRAERRMNGFFLIKP